MPVSVPQLLEILSGVVAAAAFGLSELFDHNGVLRAGTFDEAHRERLFSLAMLTSGVIVSMGMVVILAIIDPNGLLDEKVWLWLGLVYLALRRWKSNRRIDHICKQFTRHAVRVPVIYQFGSPPPFTIEEIRDGKVLLKKLNADDNSHNHRWAIAYCHEIYSSDDVRPIYVEENKAAYLSKWCGFERVTLKTSPGGYPRKLGPYELFSAMKDFAQSPGNSIWLPGGSQARDQHLLNLEVSIELDRKHGREHVAIATAWSLLVLLLEPLRLSNSAPLLGWTQTYVLYSMSLSFETGWEKLLQLARKYTQNISTDDSAALAPVVAAIANEILHGRSEWFESILPTVREFWQERVATILDMIWSVESYVELATFPALRYTRRLRRIGYGTTMQMKLLSQMRKVWFKRKEQRPRWISQEARAELEKMVMPD